MAGQSTHLEMRQAKTILMWQFMAIVGNMECVYGQQSLVMKILRINSVEWITGVITSMCS